MKEYKQYYKTKVRLIVDARGYSQGIRLYDANFSLEMDCTPVSETEKLLDIEDICILNMSQQDQFRKGSINKDYIIGVLKE